MMRQRPDMDFRSDDEDTNWPPRTEWIETSCLALLIILGGVAVIVGAPIIIEVLRRLAE